MVPPFFIRNWIINSLGAVPVHARLVPCTHPAHMDILAALGAYIIETRPAPIGKRFSTCIAHNAILHILSIMDKAGTEAGLLR